MSAGVMSAGVMRPGREGPVARAGREGPVMRVGREGSVVRSGRRSHNFATESAPTASERCEAGLLSSRNDLFRCTKRNSSRSEPESAPVSRHSPPGAPRRHSEGDFKGRRWRRSVSLAHRRWPRRHSPGCWPPLCTTSTADIGPVVAIGRLRLCPAPFWHVSGS